MKKLTSIEYLLVLALVITVSFGILMMYSASSIVAIKKYGYNSNYFFYSQLKTLGVGTIALIICALLPFQYWKKRIVSLCIIVGSILLLFLVLWKGKVVNNAQSWIFGIQPAEFIKLGVIIVLARFFSIRLDFQKWHWNGLGKIIIFLMLIFLLIYRQPNLGSALLIIGIGISMFLFSGININMLIKWIFTTGIVWVPLVYLFIKYGLSDLQTARIRTILNPFLDAQGKGYQLVNSFIAIGSGGIMGAGIGNSIQKQGFLPEPHTDFIIAIVSEELGFIGVFIIVVGIVTLVICSLKISQRCQDPFGSLIAMGLLINIATFNNKEEL